ncbi:hypothetical protein ACH5RR_040280 [Cinchona calisaya]|uniref:Uncharacterized protein n=1 Tax=Cinchona calisaya TaxID=153742 RepID=A0ABD2XS43_9GENT
MLSRQANFAFVVAVLLNFLQVKCQGKDESPFETHPKTMLAAIVSLLVYCLSYDAKLRIPANTSSTYTYFNYSVHGCMAIFGHLSLASVLSVLFPEFLCPILFSLSILLSLLQLPPSGFKTIWGWLMKASIYIIDKFHHQPDDHQGRPLIELVQYYLAWLPAQHVNRVGEQVPV